MLARSGRSTKSRQPLRQLLGRLIGAAPSATPEARTPGAHRGRLLLESLEKRQLMAADMELLFTDGAAEEPANQAVQASVQATETGGQATETGGPRDFTGTGEGESAPDLVGFAKGLSQVGVVFYGAHWCPACTQQKELFGDGKNELPFVEVSNPDRSFNATATAEGITQIPTWDFPDGSRLTGVQTLQTLSQASGVAIPTSDQPTFKAIGDLTVNTGSPLHVSVDAYDPGDGPLTTTVTVADSSLLEATVLTGNRSLRLDMTGYGDMVFELFEQRAPRASGRVAELASEGFYDGIIFHRVVDNFVIQGGDPTGTGTSGSDKGNFDDDFHPDLQHNTEGVLSFAKTTDDTNNSQFFITETDTRFLDFNHSIFGQQVEGFDVREAISGTQVNGASKPTNNVTIESATVFNDTENSVVMLKPIGDATGTTTVTFTVTDADGNSFSETITVTVAGENVNSQPFLTAIPDPAVTPAGQPAQLQLSSIDVEGDAVTYFASAGTGASAVVNASTGLLTVTPTTGFTGTVNVNVGVRPGPGVTGNGGSDSDLQTVAFTFEGESVLTPSAVDLQTGSDTGTSNIDNITNAGSQTFQVSGVANGLTVELVDTSTGSVLGTGNAIGQTITITTNNLAALGDGTYSIAARTRSGNDVSNLSPSLSVVYDTTDPSSVIGSASVTGNVGRAYVTDLISDEEGSGLVYQLTTSPTGASINASTGVINWTPTQSQLGDNGFTLQLTDVAGNTRSESFNVAVAGSPKAEIKLQITDLQGNEIDSLAVGQQFLLNMIAVDARAFVQPGVFAAYTDIVFDSALIRPVPGTSIDHSDQFSVTPKGVLSNGLIDEVGGVINSLVATNQRESLVATIRMEALSAGTVNLISDPADNQSESFLLFGDNDQIPAESVAYGNTTLAIGQSFTVTPDSFTVAEDSGQTVIDVLANDSIVTGGGQLSVVSVTQPTTGGTVSLAGGTVSFTPSANFFGEVAFTYRVSDSAGIQEDGSVTVTVTGVNDPPTGVADTLTVNQNSSANTLSVLANDSITPDSGETLTITSVGNATAGGTVSITSGGGSLQYTPAAGFVGSDTFTYTVSDGTLSTDVNVSVTVATIDHPPTAVDDSFSITEDDAEATFDVLGNDTRDTDNESFTLSTVGTPTQGGTVRIGSNGTQFLYAPAANFNGTEEVTYTIADTGGGVSVGTVTFTVAAINDPPPAENVSVAANRGDGEITAITLDNAQNVDSGETLSISTFDNATTQGGTVRLDTASGRLFYTPPTGSFTGTDTFTYTVSDGNGLSATGTVTIEVSDFATRTISYHLGSQSQSVFPGSISLKGTDSLGNAVDVPSVLNGESLDFPDVLPGNYTIEIPAIPFLQNASEPTSIAVNSLPADGDSTITGNLGRLRPEYLSIRDFLRSTPRQSLLVAVAPGQSAVLMSASGAVDTVTSPTAELDATGNTLTIRGSRLDSAQQSEDVQVALGTRENGNVQSRGEVNGLRLFKVSVEESDVTFAPTTVNTTTQSSSFPAPAQAAVQTQASETQASQTLTPQILTLGNSVAEGESPVASSVVRADVFSPAPRVDSSAASTLESDVETPLVSVESPTDVAIRSVASQLTLHSQTGDSLADPTSLSESNVDETLSERL